MEVCVQFPCPGVPSAPLGYSWEPNLVAQEALPQAP